MQLNFHNHHLLGERVHNMVNVKTLFCVQVNLRFVHEYKHGHTIKHYFYKYYRTMQNLWKD